ncbi:hypothetical protein CN135_10965 [Sinorhizobium meliloti]|uniref:hypothetical protein n=1 Tax=Rhizobium meliloti TaxID=382 RepID=UPI000FDC0ABE|nr:hypothetical protein [Sinorhizobium meliloti]MDX0105476.1 hypothetical protein [Sinorhizobium meliloti]RVL80570.1 hypothetical protein CN135_10965 [Sinorhizobium meliloti]
MEDIIIEPLGDHPRGAFCCNVKPIDNFFRKHAFDRHSAYALRVFVARRPGDTTPLGFYSLTTMTFQPGMNEEADSKFERFDAIPSVYLSMIARDREGPKGLGDFLMLNAFKRALEVREHVGVYALTLHAFNETVREIYERLGFQVFADDRKLGEYPAMFLPLSTIAATFDAA